MKLYSFSLCVYKNPNRIIAHLNFTYQFFSSSIKHFTNSESLKRDPLERFLGNYSTDNLHKIVSKFAPDELNKKSD